MWPFKCSKEIKVTVTVEHEPEAPKVEKQYAPPVHHYPNRPAGDLVKCPKCGGKSWERKYFREGCIYHKEMGMKLMPFIGTEYISSEETDFKRVIYHEYMSVTCNVCGYWDTESPADAKSTD